MPNPFKSPGSSNLGLLLVRLPVGLLFCIAGYRKLATVGMTGFVMKHMKEVPAYMPPWFPKVYLATLPFAEMALGAFVILGVVTRFSGFLLSCLLVSFLMITGIYDPAGNLPFHPNFFFLGTALLLLFTGGGGLTVDAKLFGKGGGGFSKGG